MFGHKEEKRHNCLKDHKCDGDCKYCNMKCKLNKFDNHEVHNCMAKECKYPCILCGKPCASNNHAHDDELETV